MADSIGVYKLDFEGRTYTFDFTSVQTSEWKVVRDFCGKNPFELFDAVSKTDIEATEALFWLVMRQNREPAFDPGQRQFGLLGFLAAWNDAQQNEGKENGLTSPNPTPSLPKVEG